MNTLDPDRPQPGNFSICLHCGALGIYTQDLHVRDLPAEEFAAMDVPAGVLRELYTAISRIKQTNARVN